jgi:hypothetical protein
MKDPVSPIEPLGSSGPNAPFGQRPAGPHPTPAELMQAHRSPDAPSSAPVLDHAVLCAACSEELFRLEAFDSPEPLASGRLDAAWARFGAPLEGQAARKASRRPLFAMAAGLAASLLGGSLWVATHRAGERSVPPPPAPDPAGAVRGGGELQGDWSPTGSQPHAPTEFVFPAQGFQNVMVFDSAGSYRWTSEPVEGGHVAFPEAERSKLRPGVEYFWTVLGERETAARSFTIGGR